MKAEGIDHGDTADTAKSKVKGFHHGEHGEHGENQSQKPWEIPNKSVRVELVETRVEQTLGFDKLSPNGWGLIRYFPCLVLLLSVSSVVNAFDLRRVCRVAVVQRVFS